MAMLTCYDFPTARILQAAGVPILLVGDSAANTVLGLESTREIPAEFLFTITAAVRRGAPAAFLLADMPYCATHDAGAVVTAAQRFIAETGADAVKLEATRADLPLLQAMVQARVPTCAHLGLLPQRARGFADYKARGRTPEEADEIVATAEACARIPVDLLLLEAVPDEVTRRVSAAVDMPVLGCGAGPSADGHVVVLHDVLGFSARPPRFVPVLGNVPAVLEEIARRYVAAITARKYPGPEHQYKMK